MGEKIKRYYLCCHAEKKPYLKEVALKKYGENCRIVDRLDDAEYVLVIGTQASTQMEQEIETCKMRGIPLQYVNEQFRTEEIYEALLNNHKTVEVVRSEKRKAYEKER